MPKLKEFWERYPGAEISLSPTRAYVDLVSEGFDLGIRSRHPDVRDDSAGPDLDLIVLKHMQGVGIAAPELVVKYGSRSEALPWLWHDGMDLKLELMRTSGLDVDRLKRVPIGSPNLLLEAVRGGMGATVFTEILASEEIEAGRVVRIEIPGPIHVDYVAVLPKGPPHPLAHAFADWVRSLL